MAGIAGIQTVHAATLTSASDTLSTIEDGASANHTLLFTTSSGVAEGDTVVLTFDGDFVLTSVTEDDIDISDDGVDLTTASDCTGSEEAGVGISSNIVTITICAGDGGAIAATSAVEIQVGSNATSSGTGANQITNPSAASTYYVTINGTFSDSGSLAVVISDGITQTVTTTVPSTGGGRDRDLGGGGDMTAPNICCVVISGISDTSATVSWGTDEGANSNVDYGLTTSYEIGTESEALSYVFSHSISLSGLTPGTTYHVRVRSSDNSGNQDSDSDYTFTTSDSTAPVITNVEVIDITDSGARITWSTDEASTSVVMYGLDDSYGTTLSDGALTTSHSVIVPGLDFGTSYHFVVSSVDAFSNSASSADDSFTTLANPAPGNISSLSVVASDSSLLFTWENPADADLAGVQVFCDGTSFPSTPGEGALVQDSLSETFSYPGLTNGTTYYCTFFTYDTVSQFSSGSMKSGTPVAVVIPDLDDDDADDGDSEVDDGDDGIDDGDDGDGGSSDEDVSISICGDDFCALDESALSCAVDCAVEEEIEEEIIDEDSGSDTEVEIELIVEFFSGNGNINLPIKADWSVDINAEERVYVRLPVDSIEEPIKQVVLNVGDQSYFLSPSYSEDAIISFDAVITSPSFSSLYDLNVSVSYEDGGEGIVSYVLNVIEAGMVYEFIDDELIPLEGVLVTVLLKDGGKEVVWDGSPFGEFNPFRTAEEGSFILNVPNGEYVLRLEKDGFHTKNISLSVNNTLIFASIEMVRIPVLIEEESVIAGIASTLGVEQIVDIANKVTEQIAATLEIVRGVPGVEETATIAVPVIATSAAASAVILAISFDLLPFLQYTFTAPFLFFWKRKRKGFGVVYNAMTKMPVDLAIIRLYRASDNRLVKTGVTDKGGRYFFLVDAGEYLIKVIKPQFLFPSAYLSGEKQDGEYLDVYHGEKLEVKDKSVVITANIPVDPEGMTQAMKPAKVRRLHLLRVSQNMIALSGAILSVMVLIVSPSIFAGAVVIGQVVVFLLIRRLAIPKKPKNWGIVYDKATGRPIVNAIIRIFEPKYQKILETTVTDSKGRYTALLGANTYFSTVEKKGYQTQEIKPIDFSNKKEPTELSIDVALETDEEVAKQKAQN